MGQWIVIYSFLFCSYAPAVLFNTGMNGIPYTCTIQENNISAQMIEEVPTAMDALDAIQKKYAANFTMVSENDKDHYYYKHPDADFYLVYEGTKESEDQYLIHLYEFVADEASTGIGHTVTYGWFTVNRRTGEVMEYGWE